MGRNRTLGSPFEIATITSSQTAESHIDMYAVDAALGSPVTLTLDPNAFNGDQVIVQDVGNNAGSQPILVQASPGQTILNGLGASYAITTNGGGIQLSFDVTLGGGWVPQLLGSSAATGVTSTFVYRPGGHAAGNVYTSLPALMAAVALVAGPKVVQIDDTIVSPAIIPAGTWDLVDITLVGIFDGFVTTNQAQCADGCVLLNMASVAYQLQLSSVSSAPVVTMADGQGLLLDTGASIVGSATGAPFFFAAGPYVNPPTVIMGLGAGFGGTPGQYVLRVNDNTQGVDVVLGGTGNSFPDNVVTGTGTLNLVVTETSVFVIGNLGVPPAQPAVATFFVVDGSSNHALINYSCVALSDLTNPTFLPPGYALQSSAALVPVVEVDRGLLTMMLVGCDGGGAPNAGMHVTFQLLLNGSPVAGAVIVLDADAGGTGTVNFLGGYMPTDEIELQVTPSATLATSIANIAATVR